MYPTCFVRRFCLILRGRNSFNSPTVSACESRVPAAGAVTYHGARCPRGSCRAHVALCRDDKHFSRVHFATFFHHSSPSGALASSRQPTGPPPFLLASCLALLPSCDSHKYFVPSSHPAIETGGDWPCRLSTSSPEPRSGGAVTTTLCSRMAPGPLFSVHLAVAPGKARTPRGGAALPPRPQCTGSASNKHAPNKHRHKPCGGPIHGQQVAIYEPRLRPLSTTSRAPGQG